MKTSCTLISGKSGVGKTILCMQFIYEGLKQGETAICLTVNETPKDLLDDAKSLGWDLSKYVKSKKLYFMDLLPYATIEVGKGESLDVRSLMSDLIARIKKTSAKRVAVGSHRLYRALTPQNRS